jgi:hypothetical protein
MSRIVLYSIVFVCLMAARVDSQTLVSAELVGSISKAQMISQYGPLMENGVELYRVLYETNDVFGALDTASGLLVVPDAAGFSYPFVIYQHGTIGEPDDVPSNLAGGYQLATVFGAVGFITLAPDFLGLGTSRGFHPYVHADSEAWVAVDMLFASKDFCTQSGIAFNEQLFITGYSQGGHAAAAAHRLIEQEYGGQLSVTASGPMSGPYSISGAMADFTLGDDPYFFPGYLPYVALSYNMVYGNIYDDLSEFFKPDYAAMIEPFFTYDVTLNQLNSDLISKLTQDFGASIARHMLQDSIYDILLNDPMHPVSVALADNDVYDWAPQAPTRLFYCTADDQVTFQNSLVAEAAMGANGAFNVLAIDANFAADHGGCVEPATILCIFFFKGYQSVDPLNSTSERAVPAPLLSYPNPSDGELWVSWPEAQAGMPLECRLYNQLGQQVYLREVASGGGAFMLQLPNLPGGAYTLQVRHGDLVQTGRVVLR